MSEGNYLITAYTDINMGVTRLESNKNVTSFKWCIENFRGLDPEHIRPIFSPFFSIDPLGEDKWRLGIHPMSMDSIAPLIIMRNQTNGVKELIVTVILDDPQNIQTQIVRFQADQLCHEMNFDEDKAAVRDLFVPTLDMASFGHGLITFLVEIQNPPSDQTDNSMKISAPAGSGPLQLSRDMMCALRDSRFSDINLTAEGRDIKAHKVILSTRSEVFLKMFQHPMKESADNRVEISDMTFVTLEQFVNFLYSGSVEGLTIELAKDLLVASDNYAIQDLQDTCGRFLVENISVENYVEMFVLADRHGNTILKEATFKFCIENGKKICSTPNWDAQLKTLPQFLLCELFKSAIMK